MRIAVWCVLMLVSTAAMAQPKKVTLENANGAWQMLVDGSPFYVRGAGGHVHQKKLVEIGGNTIRTWGIDDAHAILDEAQSNGLMVMMGMWAQHCTRWIQSWSEVSVCRICKALLLSAPQA